MFMTLLLTITETRGSQSLGPPEPFTLFQTEDHKGLLFMYLSIFTALEVEAEKFFLLKFS